MTNFETSILELSTGDKLVGHPIGAKKNTGGNLVFTTGMVGYVETITDPSYYGQIITFSYPMIGNYGVPELSKDQLTQSFEKDKINASGVILSQNSHSQFHWKGKKTLDAWLKENDIPGIANIDTRKLIKIIRDKENVLGRIVYDPNTPVDFYDPNEHSIIEKVSTRTSYTLGKGPLKIALIDCGVKWNIIRKLIEKGCRVEVLPWNTDFNKVNCDGWLISNGPGDPNKTLDLPARLKTILNQDKPVLGICLGFQLMSLAIGAQTGRLPFGHRGHNHPVYLTENPSRGFMTSQNHSFIVKKESIPENWSPWFLNANDESLAGILHKSKPIKGVQFHPEAAGGPSDTEWIIDDFLSDVKSHKGLICH